MSHLNEMGTKSAILGRIPGTFPGHMPCLRSATVVRYPEEFVPNERLRRARSLKGWSQAALAEQSGTSFEMVSRWERGATVPSLYYRERLCPGLGQTPEQIGLRGQHHHSHATTKHLRSFLARSHAETD